MSRYCKDKYIFIYVLAICFVKLLILICFTFTKHIDVNNNRKFIPVPDNSDKYTPFPHYRITWSCEVNLNISPTWLIVNSVFTGILVFMVAVLAIETRHVRYKQFRDTKKENIFIFLLVIFMIHSTAFSVMFSTIHMEIGADISEWLYYLSVSVLRQACLVMPKTLPLLRHIFQQKMTPLSPLRSVQSVCH